METNKELITDAQIEQAALKHVAPLFGKIGAGGDYKLTEQFSRLKAFTAELFALSQRSEAVPVAAAGEQVPAPKLTQAELSDPEFMQAYVDECYRVYVEGLHYWKNLAAQPTPAQGDALTLLQDAARAWNNERDSELDAIMERVELFLLRQRQPQSAPQGDDVPVEVGEQRKAELWDFFNARLLSRSGIVLNDKKDCQAAVDQWAEAHETHCTYKEKLRHAEAIALRGVTINSATIPTAHGNALPVAWSSEFIAQAAEEQGFVRSQSCCNVPHKYCSTDLWKGNLEGFSKAIVRLATRQSSADAVKSVTKEWPVGYSVNRTDGHGWYIDPPKGGRWVVHDGTPAADFIAAIAAQGGKGEKE